MTVDPRVAEETGVWRLPDGLEGYEVVGVRDGGEFATSYGENAGVMAVDQPGDPRRWLKTEAAAL